MNNRNIPKAFTVPPLSAEQQEIEKVLLTKNHLGKRPNAFITGGAGVGKTFLLSRLVGGLKSLKLTVAVTASTGMAAVNISGTTLHSFAGIGDGRGSALDWVKKIKSNKLKLKNWTQTNVLIIDEISMITADMFTKLDKTARIIRDKPFLPFGGMQIILFGDFFQLPPVEKVAEDGSSVIFCFESPEWKKAIDVSFELKTPFRQKDPVFCRLLDRLRMGKHTQEDIETLKSRVDVTLKTAPGIKPTLLSPYNNTVDELNRQEMLKLKGKEYTYKAAKKVFNARNQQMLKQIEDELHKKVIAEETLRLREGAQVMLIFNLNTSKGLVNGSRGVVVDFKEYGKDSQVYPVVRFNNGTECVVPREKWEIKNGAGSWSADFFQVPLKLAWATTIHKAQGQTIDAAVVYLTGSLDYGQAYVALSRVKSIESLSLAGFDERSVTTHPKVAKFYESISSGKEPEPQIYLDMPPLMETKERPRPAPVVAAAAPAPVTLGKRPAEPIKRSVSTGLLYGETPKKKKPKKSLDWESLFV